MKKVTMLQTAMVLMLSIVISNHVIIIPILLQTAKRDAWISVLISLVPLIIWILILRYISGSKQGKAMSDWLKQKLPAFIRWPIIALLAVYLFAIAFITLKDTTTWAKSMYLPQTPLFILMLSLVMFSMLAAWAGINAIAVTSGILLPVVVILGFFVITVNFQFKNYSLLFPLFTHGYIPALKGMSYVMSSFGELIVMLLIQHHLAAKARLAPLLLLALILAEYSSSGQDASADAVRPDARFCRRCPAFSIPLTSSIRIECPLDR